MPVNPEFHLSEQKELDLASDFKPMLAAGYMIHLWNTGGNVRVAEILKVGDSMGSPKVPKLGYGADGTAAQALLRARNSYFKREAEGKAVMTKSDIRDADAGYIIGAQRDGTYLDAVACLNEISFYRDDENVVAEMPTLTFGTAGRGYGRGADMVEALADLESKSGGRVY